MTPYSLQVFTSASEECTDSIFRIEFNISVEEYYTRFEFLTGVILGSDISISLKMEANLPNCTALGPRRQYG
jgi:hypothetical protein